MKDFRVDLIAGARPNFVKVAPVYRALKLVTGLECRIVHTGQHYDKMLDRVFFEDLRIPYPETNLCVGSGRHGVQTAQIIERYEAFLATCPTDAVVVFGDVNSTIACALVAAKMGVPVVHVEGGLRSFDRSMPEEINRIVTDTLSDLILVSEPSGIKNLLREGIECPRMRLVGNVMIDSLMAEYSLEERKNTCDRFGLKIGGFGLVTLHRPSNVDERATLEAILGALDSVSRMIPLIFPVHPRTRESMVRHGLEGYIEGKAGLQAVGPLSYRDNIHLMGGARLVITDSGGMQEEAAFLGVPCATMRDTTERPITVTRGTSRLVGNSPIKLRRAVMDVLGGRWKAGKRIPLWDGRAASRIALEIQKWLWNGGNGQNRRSGRCIAS